MSGAGEQVANSRMARLRERFIARSKGDREGLINALDGKDWEALRRLTHSLSGAGGIFGFPEVSRCAADLEQALDRRLAFDNLRELLAALLDEIDRCA